MNLKQTVSKILGKEVTLEQAKDFANDQFGVLSTYLKSQKAESNDAKIKVKNHKKFCAFNYVSEKSNSIFELGHVVFSFEQLRNDQNPIGVVIQLHSDNELRTDMFGNVSVDDLRFATIQDIEKYRPYLIHNSQKESLLQS